MPSMQMNQPQGFPHPFLQTPVGQVSVQAARASLLQQPQAGHMAAGALLPAMPFQPYAFNPNPFVRVAIANQVMALSAMGAMGNTFGVPRNQGSIPPTQLPAQFGARQLPPGLDPAFQGRQTRGRVQERLRFSDSPIAGRISTAVQAVQQEDLSALCLVCGNCSILPPRRKLKHCPTFTPQRVFCSRDCAKSYVAANGSKTVEVWDWQANRRVPVAQCPQLMDFDEWRARRATLEPISLDLVETMRQARAWLPQAKRKVQAANSVSKVGNTIPLLSTKTNGILYRDASVLTLRNAYFRAMSCHRTRCRRRRTQERVSCAVKLEIQYQRR